ncbi:hypothetical protein D3C80_2129580 [compost metagenome]
MNCGANVSRLLINSPSFLPLPCNLIRPFWIAVGISSCLRLICSRVALLMVTPASAWGLSPVRWVSTPLRRVRLKSLF